MRKFLAAIVFLSACYTPALAGTFNISGTISASDFSPATEFDELTTTFSGTLNFNDFNDSGGFQSREGFALSRFDPVTIGSTVFSTANVFARLFYNSNVDLFLVSIYGAPNGSGSSAGTDDLSATFVIEGLQASEVNAPTGPLLLAPDTFSFFVATEELPVLSSPQINNSTLEIAPISLPATMPLLAGALGLGLIGARRMTRRAA